MAVVKTRVGEKIQASANSARAELRGDLAKIAKFPGDTLWSVLANIAKTYPACNTAELAAYEAERLKIADPQEFYDLISAWTYIWENSEGDSPQDVTQDLLALNVLSTESAEMLTWTLTKAAPFRDSAQAAASYLRIGAPLFVGLRGVVDIRCRFHKRDEELYLSRQPSELVDTQQVVLANMTISDPTGEEEVVSFLMDENDLRYMGRFVRNMEQELELTKSLLKSRS